MNISVFIISWSGKHEKALSIYREIEPSYSSTKVIWSDPNEGINFFKNCHEVRRPNTGFFTDKFKACLDEFDGDVLLVIHADCVCDNWLELVVKCESSFKAFKNIGVWSPLINWTAFNLARTEVSKIKDTNLSLAVQTDSIVFGLSKSIVRRLKLANFEENVYGWGIGWMSNANALATGQIVVVDRSVKVFHPKESGYSIVESKIQRDQFLKQLYPVEFFQMQLMRNWITKNGSKLL